MPQQLFFKSYFSSDFADDCVTSCKGQDPGFYQLCDTCKQYLKCKKRGAKKFSCKGKLKWNPVKGKCTAKSKCKVMKNDPPTTTTTVPPPTTATPILTTAGECIIVCSIAFTLPSVFFNTRRGPISLLIDIVPDFWSKDHQWPYFIC